MTHISVETPNGSIDAVLEIPSGDGPWPAVVVIHDAFGLREPGVGADDDRRDRVEVLAVGLHGVHRRLPGAAVGKEGGEPLRSRGFRVAGGRPPWQSVVHG